MSASRWLSLQRQGFSGDLPVGRQVSLGDYLQLLDWTARQMVSGKRGATPTDAPPIFERLSMSGETWCELVRNFGRLFYNVAGHPHRIEAARSRQTCLRQAGQPPLPHHERGSLAVCYD
ncbi:MAG TPA: hypothetical protein VMM76_07570 [Pirellulaceae bacterium]|nr:hypothetical protein [Pirellulaceae bacterium]